MTTADYLNNLLSRYSSTFDIQKPYIIHGKEYPAYGYFFSRTEKYVLVREANMWSQECFEHFIVIEAEQIGESHIKEADYLIREYMEPELVRKGDRYPGKEHMYSYLSVILLSEKRMAADTIKKIRKYSYDIGYRFHMRGFSQGRLAAVSMEDERAETNFAYHKMKKMFREAFDKAV